MNTEAFFKTLGVVLLIGSAEGFNEWRTVKNEPPEDRTKREINQCVKDRQEAAYRENTLKYGHIAAQEKQKFEDDCRAQQSEGLQLGKSAEPVSQKSNSSVTVEVNSVHYSQNGQAQTQSKEECLEQLNEARKRSPHGLAPEWEQRQKARCEDFYTEKSQ